jgi:hypothetical protein
MGPKGGARKRPAAAIPLPLGWTQEEASRLSAARRTVDPLAPDYWQLVAAEVGRSRADCIAFAEEGCDAPVYGSKHGPLSERRSGRLPSGSRPAGSSPPGRVPAATTSSALTLPRSKSSTTTTPSSPPQSSGFPARSDLRPRCGPLSPLSQTRHTVTHRQGVCWLRTFGSTVWLPLGILYKPRRPPSLRVSSSRWCGRSHL